MLEMAAVYVVLERTFNPFGELWLKAMRLFLEDETLPEPEKGQRYYLCGATLTPTQSFRPIPDGFDICTANSRYHAKLLTGSQLDSLVKQRGFTHKRTDLGIIYYTK